MSSGFIKLFHATLGEVYDIRPDDDFANVTFLSMLFDGWMAKLSLEEQEHNIKKNHTIYECDIPREKIAKKKDLIRNDEALKVICDEIALDDMNYADMLADLIFESPDKQNYTYDELLYALPIKLPEKRPTDPEKLHEMKLRYARFEVMRLLGQIAKSQGYDAISIFRTGAKDILVVNPEVSWIKH